MWMGEHSAHLVELRPVPRKEGELNREHHLADDPQWFPVCQIVQRRRDPTLDRVLDRHQGGGDVTVTDGLEGLPHSRVRGGLVWQCGQRQQRLMGESPDRSVIAIVVRWDCEHRLRLSLCEAAV